MLTALMGLSITSQIFVFLVSSLFLIYFTRPFAVNFLKVGKEKTNSQSLIGNVGLVIEEIRPFETGLVKISGQIWTARSPNKEVIKRKEKVRVIAIEGVKLIVEKLKKE